VYTQVYTRGTQVYARGIHKKYTGIHLHMYSRDTQVYYTLDILTAIDGP
jgi:hypothetical protein